MERYTRWSSPQSAEEDQEFYHCTPAYGPSDIVCPGSDTEETPDETKAKRERYEDAARRYMAGERPMILSASLRGPLDSKSGWINPWRYCPRKPSAATWWQPGSDYMLFTRENVTQRAAAFGLGYMTPKEALAWCKASAQAELESQYEAESRFSLLQSIEADEPENLVDCDKEKTVEDLGDSGSVPDGYASEAQKGEQSSINNKYSSASYVNDNRSGTTQIAKRSNSADWLKGSYPSKRARWDGPALPSPTPVASTNSRREQRRRTAQASRGRSIQHERSALREGLHGVRGQGSSLRYSDHIMPSHTSDNRKSRFEGSTESLRQQIEYPDELDDDFYDAKSDVFPSLISQAKSRRSPRDAGEQALSNSEPDELVTTPSCKRKTKSPVTRILSSNQRSGSSLHKLPTVPRAAATFHQEAVYTEEDSFVTDVAPSSRDLDKFVFKKKKRSIRKPESFEAVLGIHRPSGSQYIDSASRTTPPTAPVSGGYPDGPQSPEDQASRMEEYIDLLAEDEEAQSAKSDDSHISRLMLDYVKTNFSLDEVDNSNITNRSLPKKPLPVGNSDRQETLRQKNSLSTLSSQITQPKDSFQKLPHKPKVVHKITEDAIDPKMQETPSKVVPENSVRNDPSSQDPNDISTQSYNTTPTCSRRNPTQLALTSGRSPKLARLLRFSFENTVGGSLFSPIAGVEDGYQEGVVSKMQSPVQVSKRSQGGNPIEYELDNYKLYMRGEARNQEEETQDNPIRNDPESPAKEDEIVVKRENSEDTTDQIQNSLSKKFPSISCKSSTRSPSPQQIREHPEVVASYSARNSISGAAHVEKTLALISPKTVTQVEQQNIHMLDQQATLEDSSDGERDHDVTLTQAEPQETTMNEAKGISEDSSGSRCGKEATRKVAPQNIKRIDLKATMDECANVNGDQDTTPNLHKHQDEATLGSLLSQGEFADVGFGKEVTPHQATQVAQSPFAQETFFVDGLVLKANEPKQGFDTTMMSEDELEPGREGCGPQSPWVRDISDQLPHRSLSNTMDPRSPIRLLSDSDTMPAVLEGIFIKRTGAELQDGGTTFTELPRTPEDDNFGFVPFKDLMSPPPALNSRTMYSNDPPTNTQQLVEAALKNPWSSSFKKSSSIKARKRVSFNDLPPDDSENADDAKGLGEFAASPPPPEEALLNEHIFGGGFTRTAPFSNHFSAARTRMVTRILPPASQSTNNSSPHLSAQAEAFIVADSIALPDQGRSSNDLEDPSRYLKPRSEMSENSRWKGWGKQRRRLDDTSPRSLPPSRQAHSPSMSNFNMEEALGEMDEFLEDWSVEAELKKAKEMAKAKETEDNDIRRQRFSALA